MSSLEAGSEAEAPVGEHDRQIASRGGAVAIQVSCRQAPVSKQEGQVDSVDDAISVVIR